MRLDLEPPRLPPNSTALLLLIAVKEKLLQGGGQSPDTAGLIQHSNGIVKNKIIRHFMRYKRQY